jgi:hypothetical protein
MADASWQLMLLCLSADIPGALGNFGGDHQQEIGDD